MAKSSSFEIYESISGRKKKYIVTKIDADYVTVIDYAKKLFKYAKKLFKCSEAHIDFTCAWIYKGKLYLDDPEKVGAKKVGVAYWV